MSCDLLVRWDIVCNEFGRINYGCGVDKVYKVF